MAQKYLLKAGQSSLPKNRNLFLGISVLALTLVTDSQIIIASSYPEVQIVTGKLEGGQIKIGKAGWFGQYGWGKYKTSYSEYTWYDRLNTQGAMKGIKQTEPGIALSDRKTLGHWFDIEIKEKVYRVRQVDIGPAKWTGRQLNINAALADLAGFSPKNFPTNHRFKYRYVGKEFKRDDIATQKISMSIPKKDFIWRKNISLPPKMSLGVPIEREMKIDKEKEKIEKLKERLLNIYPQVVGKYPYGLHPVIKTSMLEASKYLPKGYKIRFNSAARGRGMRGSFHSKRERYKGNLYALAVDISIVDNEGKPFKNLRAPQNFTVYREFMQNVKKIQYDKFPSYRGKGRWGGYFLVGVSQDLMHYDLGPEMMTAAGNWETGLKHIYSFYGKRWDVGEGMGKIKHYKLPAIKETIHSAKTDD